MRLGLLLWALPGPYLYSLTSGHPWAVLISLPLAVLSAAAITVQPCSRVFPVLAWCFGWWHMGVTKMHICSSVANRHPTALGTIISCFGASQVLHIIRCITVPIPHSTPGHGQGPCFMIHYPRGALGPRQTDATGAVGTGSGGSQG